MPLLYWCIAKGSAQTYLWQSLLIRWYKYVCAKINQDMDVKLSDPQRGGSVVAHLGHGHEAGCLPSAQRRVAPWGGQMRAAKQQKL